jgi:hypothetical protein
MKIATKRAWITEDGDTLVEDGDTNARILFATVGQLVADTYTENFSNADSFFDDYTPEVQEPLPHGVKPDVTVPGESNLHPTPYGEEEEAEEEEGEEGKPIKKAAKTSKSSKHKR